MVNNLLVNIYGFTNNKSYICKSFKGCQRNLIDPTIGDFEECYFKYSIHLQSHYPLHFLFNQKQIIILKL